MKNIAAALLAIQAELMETGVKKTSNNPAFKSAYAGLPEVLDHILPVLNRHGVVLMQLPQPSTALNILALETRLIHAESAEEISSVANVPIVKTDPQGYGSAVTYARRYAIKSLLALKDIDDDGENAMDREGRGQEQGRRYPTAPPPSRPNNPAPARPFVNPPANGQRPPTRVEQERERFAARKVAAPPVDDLSDAEDDPFAN